MRITEYLSGKGKLKALEKIAEHAFSKELLISSAYNQKDVVLSQGQSTLFGYDVIIQRKQPRKTMIVQLITYFGEKRIWYIDKKLIDSKTGNVCLIHVEEKNKNLEFEYYLLDKKKASKLPEQPKTSIPLKIKTRKSEYVKIPAIKLYNKLFVN